MKFFFLTSSEDRTAHVPVSQLVRMETFSDTGQGTVSITFSDPGMEKGFIVTINTIEGAAGRVLKRIQGDLESNDSDPIVLGPNKQEITEIFF